MTGLMMLIREKYHPIYRLRRYRSFQALTRLTDVPVSIRIYPIEHPICVSLSKNLALVLSGGRAGEERERKNYIEITKRGGFKSFLDIGANVGLYGFLFHSLISDSEVTMIEPDARNAALIRRTISRFGISGVNLIEAAASEKAGTASFFKDDVSGATGSLKRGGADYFISSHHHASPEKIAVRCISVDELPGMEPDFIKMDVEGAELDALKGARNLIHRSQPALFFECDANQEAVKDFLADYGYIFFDFASLQPVEVIPHNCLALHPSQHGKIIESIGRNRPI